MPIQSSGAGKSRLLAELNSWVWEARARVTGVSSTTDWIIANETLEQASDKLFSRLKSNCTFKVAAAHRNQALLHSVEAIRFVWTSLSIKHLIGGPGRQECCRR